MSRGRGRGAELALWVGMRHLTTTMLTVSLLACGLPDQSLDSSMTVERGLEFVSLSNVIPENGPQTGGTSVEIQGTGFAANVQVKFGGVSATSVSFVSSSVIRVVTPAHAPGPVLLEVINPGGYQTSLGNGFTFDVVQTPTPTPTPTGRDAFASIEAESYDAATGIQVGRNGGSAWIGFFDNQDAIKYSQVNFGAGASAFEAMVAVPAPYDGQSIELRLDSKTGPIIGTMRVAATATWFSFVSQRVAVSGASGLHDLWLIGRGASGVANIDRFQFARTSTGTGGGAAGGTAGGSTAGGSAGGTAGGSTAGGTAGGSTAGGRAGGSSGGTAGGSTAGGTAGGSTAGGGATAGGSASTAPGPRVTTFQTRGAFAAVSGTTYSGLRISNPSGPCITVSGASNVTIVDSELGPCGGEAAIVVDGTTASILLDHLAIHDSPRGVLVSGANGVTTSNSTFDNINGTIPRGTAVEYDYITGGGAITGNQVRGSYNSDAISGFQSSGLRITSNDVRVTLTHIHSAPFTIGDSVNGTPGHDNYVANNKVTQNGGVPPGVFGSTGNTMLENNCLASGIQAYNYNNAPFVGVTVRNNVIGPGSFVPDTSVIAGWSTNSFPSSTPACP